MLERKADQVSVVSRSSSARRSLERLAGQLGLRTGAPGDRAVGPGSASGAVLFHLAGPSESALRELREVVRNAFPSPVVVLTSGPEDEVRRRALGAGAAEVIRLEPDETRTEAALAGVLARLRGPGSAPCPRCPVAGAGDGAPACLMGGSEGAGDGRPDADVAEDGHWRCFPFLATSPAMRRAEEVARKAARADATVLIHGESGSGKEVLARYIHWTGPRSRGPFVKVNCAALPDNLLESELFGYEKGAFTGAETRKPGRFELARGGVILLDEVAEMSLGLQAKLLQVLQERRFTPLGGVRELEVDVQILATTNKDLEPEIADGRFRRDLYFRLRVIDLPVPPLRERPEDVPVLARYFACRFSTQYGQCAPELDPAALARLSRAPWPGNVRELENLMRRFVILGEEDVLLGPTSSARDHPTAGAEATPSPTAEPLTLRAAAQRAVRAAEREAILAALERTRWNRTQAARVLGVSYKTLLTKMKQLLD